MSRREATRGVTPEGRAHEFIDWHKTFRPDVGWPTAFLAWLEVIGGLPVDVAREVRIQVIRIRSFGATP
jgi:hypothetical protein